MSLALIGAVAAFNGGRAQAADIVETAQAAGQFKTLLKAATAAGVAPALKGKGPLTVFAPTDAAFAKVPPSVLQNLLKPENKATLAKVLKYHVVSGRVPASAVMKLPSCTNVKTLAGEPVAMRKSSGVMIDFFSGKANVTKTDIRADNGIIHVVDTVLIPPSVAMAMMQSGAG